MITTTSKKETALRSVIGKEGEEKGTDTSKGGKKRGWVRGTVKRGRPCSSLRKKGEQEPYWGWMRDEEQCPVRHIQKGQVIRVRKKGRLTGEEKDEKGGGRAKRGFPISSNGEEIVGIVEGGKCRRKKEKGFAFGKKKGVDVHEGT